ncbi:MAG: type VI secretion system baseplate subunit TssE [Treponema sp.]|jgi:type VI secretion system protein ImpF|nr:type VI secretion system baseplate subunit TssE [Treponema sp.]
MDDSLQYQGGPIKEEAKYRPFVLKRLTDMEPQTKKELPYGLETANRLKEDIFNNIEMLFNSRSHTASGEMGEWADVEDSVLGFGVKDFCGRTSSDDYKEELRQHITKQLRIFEPRLDPASITVDFSQEKDGSVLEYSIGGVIRVKEVNEEVKFFSNLDLESGNASLSMADE